MLEQEAKISEPHQSCSSHQCMPEACPSPAQHPTNLQPTRTHLEVLAAGAAWCEGLDGGVALHTVLLAQRCVRVTVHGAHLQDTGFCVG